MIQGKANFVIDAHFGSSGKGKISTWLADTFKATDISASNGPNAGHTAEIGDVRFVAKVLPTPAILNHQRTIRCWISPESYFKTEQFEAEMLACRDPLVRIHERAGIVTAEHVSAERSTDQGTGHIASTMQGTGTAMCDKIMRRKNVVLARDVFPLDFTSSPDCFARDLDKAIKIGMHLHEVSQGWALGVNYGLSYPYCTSRSISVSKALDDLSLPPSACGDVYLNLRTFPIRVGNLTVGDEVHSSGPFFPDTEETTWEKVGTDAGMPAEEIKRLFASELTTVTKRLRRVSIFPWESIADIARVTGATKLCLNFAQYLDWNDYLVRDWNKLSNKTKQMVFRLEDACNLPVVFIGTGAEHNDVVARF